MQKPAQPYLPNCLYSSLCAGLLALTACGNGDPVTAFKSGDYARSLAAFSQLAESGDKQAQNYLAVHYAMGLGTERDEQKAVMWYAKAAVNGEADAQWNLGKMYYNGRGGLAQNTNCAYAWYWVAEQNGHPQAKQTRLSMGNELTPNKTRIMENRITNLLRGQPGELKIAAEGGAEYIASEQGDVTIGDLNCDGGLGLKLAAAAPVSSEPAPVIAPAPPGITENTPVLRPEESAPAAMPAEPETPASGSPAP